MREVVGSIPTATTTFFPQISHSYQLRHQFTRDVILRLFTQGVASRFASKTCLQRFAKVLHCFFHALGYSPGVKGGGVQARVSHQVFDDRRI